MLYRLFKTIFVFLFLSLPLVSCAHRLIKGDSEHGIATWYGEQYQGHRTASGESFDKNALTAAHKTLPMNSIVQVTNLANGQSVSVRINDRGPYGKGRIIDLSEAAARKIGLVQDGMGEVELHVLSLP